MAKCEECPVKHLCRARKIGKVMELPVKTKAKARRIEKRTIFIFQDGEKIAIRKRPAKGLLAGLYELPGRNGHLSEEEALAFCRQIGLAPIRIQALGGEHISCHVEWNMIGYKVRVDELEKNVQNKCCSYIQKRLRETIRFQLLLKHIQIIFKFFLVKKNII